MTMIQEQRTDLLQSLQNHQPSFWINPHIRKAAEALADDSLQFHDIEDAADRLERFAPLLSELFPELRPNAGVIESPLIPAINLQNNLLPAATLDRTALYIKADHSLPVAGSVKARGGLYEVLVVTEQLATEAGLYSNTVSTTVLKDNAAKKLFSSHTISVGSSGNLGLSIGVVAAALGFSAVVHMSAEAKEWKKQRLRDRGVRVVEHQGDFTSAVAAGRQQAASDPLTHFVDDENSLPLFLGYSVAALRLKRQLAEQKIVVDQQHPLFIYIPCGVGGAPGGITFGLKQLFGDHVHCFFAEPLQSPCMLAELAASELGLQQAKPVSVYDIGLNNATEADGLAVSAASQLVANKIRGLVSGIFTVDDRQLLIDVHRLHQSESLFVEPSAAASFTGPKWLLSSPQGKQYLQRHGLLDFMANASHILWTTGGAFVPEQERKKYLQKGEQLNVSSQTVEPATTAQHQQSDSL